jgi:ribose transport system substrate-binding protein
VRAPARGVRGRRCDRSKRSCLGLTAILLTLLAACRDRQAPPAEPPRSRLIGSAFQSLRNPFFVDLNDGIREVVVAHGDRLVALDSHWDRAQQSRDISVLIEKDVSVIFVNPVDWEGIRGDLGRAVRKGILCVAVDAPIHDAELVLCQVASDNVEAGRMAARALAKVRPAAQVVVLHIPTNKACIDRLHGFEEELVQTPMMRILGVEDGKGTAEGSRPAMRLALDKYPTMNGVFAVNDPSAMGAIATLDAAKKLRAVTVVSVDGSPEGIAAIKTRKLYATSAQFPREIGRIAAQRVYEHWDGETVEKDIKIPVELITPDNVDAFSAPR